MFIELTELLRCPSPHPEAHLVLATGEMSGRAVLRGIIGCPQCHAEFRIEQGVGRFGKPDEPKDDAPVPDPSALQAFLGLTNPGGYVALLGSAARAGAELAALLGGVRLVAVNAPPDVARGPMLSLLESTASIPLKTGSVRGVVVGGERAGSSWLDEAVRTALPGQRIVVLSDAGDVKGVERMATGPGVWVGVKKGR